MDILIGSILGTIIIIFVVIACSPRPETPSQKGARGELKVSGILHNLPENYYVIDDLTIPTRYSTTQIDHVVVSVYGIFVIETKNYSGWIFGANNTKKWKQTFRTESNYFYNPIKQNWAHIYALSELLKIDRRCFRPVVAFSDDATLNVESSSHVINMHQLKSHILSYTKEIFSSEQAIGIYNYLHTMDTIGDNLDKDIHVNNVRNSLETQNETISHGKCPRCGGNLILRKGRYGEFYGCSNYPKCRFTADL
ncbi:MAG: NERD domain-containing protein [Oscillospiraceae bacterium]|nr:NERD domain-containing protein [Oscillospiraceae bacterium]